MECCKLKILTAGFVFVLSSFKIQATSALTINEVDKFLADDATAEDLFGWSVAVTDDTAVIGSYVDDDNGTNSGSAYIFVRSETGWRQQAKLTASDAESEDFITLRV